MKNTSLILKKYYRVSNITIKLYIYYSRRQYHNHNYNKHKNKYRKLGRIYIYIALVYNNIITIIINIILRVPILYFRSGPERYPEFHKWCFSKFIVYCIFIRRVLIPSKFSHQVMKA